MDLCNLPTGLHGFVTHRWCYTENFFKSHMCAKLKFIFCCWCFGRISAEVALQALNGVQLGRRNLRLSWGHGPNNKQVNLCWHFCRDLEFLRGFLLNVSFGCFILQSQPNLNQWDHAAYYGYPQGYNSYGYVSALQDPNMYYGGYLGYGGYAMP